jgi:hypothetical protein
MLPSQYADGSLACRIESLDYQEKTAPLAAAVDKLVRAARALIDDGFSGTDVKVAREFITAVEAAEHYSGKHNDRR